MSRAVRAPDLAGAAQWRQCVTVCATNRWDGVKLHDRSLAEQLARHVPVLYVDPPISPATPRRRADIAAPAAPRVRMVADNLAQLAPVVLPGLRRRGVATANSEIVRRQIRRAVRDLGVPVAALVEADVLFPAFGAARERLRVYWAQDDYAGGAALLGLDPVRVQVAEVRVAAKADVVITASPVVHDKLTALGASPILIPYGCDPEAFAGVETAADPEDVDLPGPVAGLVGHINARIDLGLLEAVAEAGHSLLLVGPIDPTFEPDRMRALLGRKNVVSVGRKPAESLPSYLKAIDVGLVPYADTAFNRGSFPLKTLEYLAAGRAAVSTDLPATRWLDSSLIVTATTPPEFEAAVAAELQRERSGQAAAARRAFAESHSWARRAADFAAAIRVTRPDGSVSISGGDRPGGTQ
ncbi:glycosyltransferase [Frankia sp. R43]|uniref:glycosyltransferase n=1 Tax=Frankia sp. R43 TaxID=269536 RepID=UPI000AA8C1A3|nr:glycosyltransferase [Frankia sp. R43]